MIVLAILLLVSAVFWFFNYMDIVKIENLSNIGVILLIGGFALALAVSRLKSVKAGLTAEDELSKRIRDKASSRTYYVSLYMWLIIGYLSDRTSLEFHTLIGVGIIGMALLFAGFWLYFNFKGNFND